MEELQKKMNECSRHRYKFAPVNTPAGMNTCFVKVSKCLNEKEYSSIQGVYLKIIHF